MKGDGPTEESRAGEPNAPGSEAVAGPPDPAPSPSPGEGAEDEPRWSFGAKVLFRFGFVYFFLYALPGMGLTGSHAPWVAEHVLKLSEHVTIAPNGSGDTTWNYVDVFSIFALSALACATWSVLDFRRAHYRRLGRWLSIGCRYWLATTMLGYGFAKIFQSQFPFPSLSRLVTPYGDSSPMGLVWTFMGYSPAYNFFTGGSEVLGALLLFFRRTTTLGALVVVGVMSNVVMLNFGYDVPVKLLSSHLLLAAAALASLDARRLAAFFFGKGAVPPADVAPYFQNRDYNIVLFVVKMVLISLFLWQSISSRFHAYDEWGPGRPAPPLRGIYDVETFSVNGVELPPLTTDQTRWQTLIVDWEGWAKIRLMDGSFESYPFQVDEEKQAIRIATQRDRSDQRKWTYEQPSPGVLILEGELAGQHHSIRLTERDPDDFLLVRRGFRWINEYPFNR